MRVRCCLAMMAVVVMVVARPTQLHGTIWEDCSPKSDGHFPNNGTAGPYGPVHQYNVTWDGRPMVVFAPTQAPGPAPLIVFMHGITALIEMYLPNLINYASHGFVVVFPYIVGPEIDHLPITTNTDGTYILHGVAYAKHANSNSSSPLYQRIDTENIVISGHSMGGTCSIMAGTKLHPSDGVKLMITQHPGICGPIGPPPWPATWFEKDLRAVADETPILFTTATNDKAFWPAPHTAEHELGCFSGALGNTTSAREATFVQFSALACDSDGARDPYDDSGHDCAFKNDVETPWVLTAAKLYAQQGGNRNSGCGQMLFGDGKDSLGSDAHVEKLVRAGQ